MYDFRIDQPAFVQTLNEYKNYIRLLGERQSDLEQIKNNMARSCTGLATAKNIELYRKQLTEGNFAVACKNMDSLRGIMEETLHEINALLVRCEDFPTTLEVDDYAEPAPVLQSDATTRNGGTLALNYQKVETIKKCCSYVDCLADDLYRQLMDIIESLGNELSNGVVWQDRINGTYTKLKRIDNFQNSFITFAKQVRDLEDTLKTSFISLVGRDSVAESKFEDYLRNLKNEDGTSKYAKEDIEKMVAYVKENYPSSLEALCHIPSQYYKYALEQCETYADEIFLADNLKTILAESGWNKDCISDGMVEELVNTLKKYNITSREQICAFIAECMYESDYGRGLTEYGSDSYFSNKRYGKRYRGSGYIHITWKYGYQAFATYLMLRDYPQLQQYGKYLNPNNSSEESIERRYNDIVKAAGEMDIDISRYTAIVDEGADYVAENYAWESAGYFWDINNINFVIENGGSIDDVSKIINRWDTGTFDKREACYEKVLSAFDEAY